ncbi:hypothetical protein SEA_BONAMASSA_77 [Mycobacterium phage Bonamassa]|uniref:Uncharacterized protein n=2 Tax=Caudoviricetes TaxID=2731619 RepID=S5XWN3_9CAUD|nr:hypothetical protein O156_gp18 [Mycobacterium phage LittleCherry]YP_009635834.1 hypothetical protein FGG53_gp16 [Mycobacterium phage George]ATW60469.1 hypothetical protein SEA_FORGETIT_77 [Mycobacterium phage ForGetIt]AXC33897.1 hypothetical protein SEA_TARYNEARAL_76 [Mycobacterium phage Tarynearal]QAX92750.1 hypothetical protein SEA_HUHTAENERSON15_75 [Mycobacterium phage HuhtaEnerson15]QGJ97272.1 hypothetical protein SEA_LEV2_77 [Mycobacterium phage Lev2]UJQ86311.1 hypothetical protein SE
MRCQVTIENNLLSPRTKSVTIIDGGSMPTTVEVHHVKSDDAEYQLLATAIDRFASVMRLRAELKKEKQS